MFETRTLNPMEQRTIKYLPEQITRDDLRPTEQINEGRMRSLAKQIEHNGLWTKPILIEASSMAIMDGHHRFHASKLLGLKRLPCLVLSYDDPNLSVVSWAGGAPFDPARILEAANSGVLLGFKTTKHSFCGDANFLHLPLETLK